MIGKGTFIFKLKNEKTVGFKFGMIAASFMEKESKLSISEILIKIGENSGETMGLLLNSFYGAAMAYAKKEDAAWIPTKDEVGDWLDEIGYDASLKMFNDSFAGPEDPNVEAPK